MQIFRGRSAWVADVAHPVAPVVAIGNFDGVHLGHQALVERARRRAPHPAQVGVLTFDPHPAHFFAPRLAPPMIMPLAKRLETLGRFGVSFALVETFDAALASMSPEDFVRAYLHRDLGVAHVVVGYDFAFGKGRKGNTADLVQLAASVGMGADVLEPVTVEGIVCSSTKVRAFVLEGKVEGARLLLGRPFALSGTVVHGAQRGRVLGYPTANLAVDNELVPKPGIYAARVYAEDPAGPQGVAAAVSVGTNPTFSASAAVSVEAHLLDFTGNLYDSRLNLHFLGRLRDEQRFEGAEALVAQIALDVEHTRALLRDEPSGSPTPSPS